MDRYRSAHWSRREFLGGLALAGTAGLTGLTPEQASADPPPETKTIRLIYDHDDYDGCYAPINIAGQFMRAEDFTNVRYGKDSEGIEPKTMAAGLGPTTLSGWTRGYRLLR